jgi:hypothetical protein
MKTYVLTVSRTFPGTHKRKGDETYFVEQIQNALAHYKDGWPTGGFKMKLHTIRANYPLWKKRFEEIDKGEAYLSLRYWSGFPYKSKQVEFARLTKDDGIGLQEFKVVEYVDEFVDERAAYVIDNSAKTMFLSETIANNDGLSIGDWREWFRNYDLSKHSAIIHFTNFRY